MNNQLQLEQTRKMLPLSEAIYLILLALTEPQHGYGIMQTLAEGTEGAVRLGPGTHYGALNNLLKQGLIERAGVGEADHERRKLYALTPLGRATAELEHERLQSMDSIGRRIFVKAKGAQRTTQKRLQVVFPRETTPRKSGGWRRWRKQAGTL